MIDLTDKAVAFPFMPLALGSFTGWTDGPRWILDTRGEIFQIPPGISLVSASLEDCKRLMHYGLPKSCTFYINCDIQEFIKLVKEFPLYTLNLLVKE